MRHAAMSAALAAVALSGCAAQHAAALDQLHAAPAAAGAPIVVGTLATNDCEARTAAVYTAAIVAVRRAELHFQQGDLQERDAVSVLELGREAKADLDAACPAGQLDTVRFASATADVERMQRILGGAR